MFVFEENTHCEKIEMHTSPITSVKFSSDGSLATVGYDGKVIRWAADLSDPIWESRSTALLNNLQIKNEILFSVGANRKIHSFDFKTGVSTNFAESFSCGDDLNAIVIAEDSQRIIVAGEEAVVYCLDLEGKLVWKYQSCDANGNNGECIDAISVLRYRDDEAVVFGDDRGNFTVLSVRDAGRVLLRRKLPGKVESIADSKNSNIVLLGLDTGCIAIFECKSNEEWAEAIIAVHSSTVKAVALIGGRGLAVSASYDGYLVFLSLRSRAILARVRIDGFEANAWARSISVNPMNENAIALSTLGCRPLVIDVDATVRRSKIVSMGSREVGVTRGLNCLSTSDMSIYGAGDDGSIYKFAEQKSAMLATIGVMINDISLGRDESVLYAGTQDGSLVAIDVISKTVIWSKYVFDCPVTAVEVVSDSVVAIGSYGGSVAIFDINCCEVVHSIQLLDTIKTICLADGVNIVVGDADGHIYIVNVAERRVLAQVDDCYLVNSVSWCGVTRRIASVGRDCKLRIWDEWLNCIETRIVHEKSVKSVSWSSDGSSILTGGYDGKLGIHRLGESQYFLEHRQPGISAVDWDAGGRPVSVGWDGRLLVWTIGGRVIEEYSL